MRLLCGCYAVAMQLLCCCYAVAVLLLCGCYVIAMQLLCCFCAVAMWLLWGCYAIAVLAMRLLCCCYAVAMWLLFSSLFRTFSLFPLFFEKLKIYYYKIKSLKKLCWHVKFIENIFLFKKEIATAIELDLRPLGKMMIFRDTHTNRTFLLYIDQLLPTTAGNGYLLISNKSSPLLAISWIHISCWFCKNTHFFGSLCLWLSFFKKIFKNPKNPDFLKACAVFLVYLSPR